MKLTRFEESCCSFNIPKELTRPVGDTWIVIVTHRWERWRIEEAEAGMLLKSTSQTQSRSVSQQYTIPDQKKEQVWTTHSCKFLCLRELHFNKIQHTCGARRRWGGGCAFICWSGKRMMTHTHCWLDLEYFPVTPQPFFLWRELTVLLIMEANTN